MNNQFQKNSSIEKTAEASSSQPSKPKPYKKNYSENKTGYSPRGRSNYKGPQERDRGKDQSSGKKVFRKPYNSNKKRLRIPQEVRDISREHNLPIFTSLLVYKEKVTLEEVLQQKKEKEERKQEARKICAKHRSINLALACLLVKENMTAEDFFAKRKAREEKKREKEQKQKLSMKEDNSQEKAFQTLTEHIKREREIVLMRYEKGAISGALKDFTPYDFLFSTQSSLKKIHRLEIKYMYEKSEEKGLDKMIMYDKGVQKQKLRPSHGPDGRYHFSQSVLQNGTEVMIILHQGEILRGIIEWFTPYDILLKVGSKKVWVFRHAVVNCSALRRPPKKDAEKKENNGGENRSESESEKKKKKMKMRKKRK